MSTALHDAWDALARAITAGQRVKSHTPPPRLEVLSEVFGLTNFERDVVLLCAGSELHPGLMEAIAHGTAPARPSPALALACLPDGHWDAFAPLSPLRAWLLIDLDRDAPLLSADMRVDPTLVPWLLGESTHDPLIAGLVSEGRAVGRSAGDDTRATALAELFLAAEQSSPRLALTGPDPALREQLACAIAERLGRAAWMLDGSVLPERPDAADALARRLSRAAALDRRLLVLDIDRLSSPADEHRATWVLERLQMPVIISGRRSLAGVGAAAHEVDPPAVDERRELWRSALGQSAAALNGDVERLAGHFALGRSVIDEIARGTAGLPAPERAETAWALARAHTRPALAELATPVRGETGWDALILPGDQIAVLRAMCAQVRTRHVVYGTWGMAPGSGRGRGITALFAGPSGTGKTLAAEVIGNELGLDVFRVDLSTVVSKYIGETEKNLRQVFDASESGSAVLLFDEADALFGRRTEVKDSHDRFANIEVSYLLQRMEAYGGLAILTTNMRDALDDAFLRRLRFIVEFPFPDALARKHIWETMYPATVPLDAGLRYDALARLNIAGGSIRNVALNAAFYAAHESQPVGMEHVLRAARAEYAKLQRPISSGELAGFAA